MLLCNHNEDMGMFVLRVLILYVSEGDISLWIVFYIVDKEILFLYELNLYEPEDHFVM